METTIVFGSLILSNDSTSYVFPSMLAKEQIQKFAFDEQQNENIVVESKTNGISKVTHRVFFGENIKRGLSILRKNG